MYFKFQIGSHVIMDVRDSMLESLQNQIMPKIERFGQDNSQIFRESNNRSHVIKGQKKKSGRPPIFIKRRLESFKI